MWRAQTALWSVVVVGVVLQGCQTPAPRSLVPIAPGSHIAKYANIQADSNTVKAILSAFTEAERAVKRGDVDGVMQFYAREYKHQGYNALTIRRSWEELFAQYDEIATVHTFSRIVVQPESDPRRAQVTCSGEVRGISKDTHELVNVADWEEQVHFLVFLDGRWRIRRHAWEVRMDKESRAARPPHPFS